MLEFQIYATISGESILRQWKSKLGTIGRTCNSSTWEAEAGDCKLKTSLLHETISQNKNEIQGSSDPIKEELSPSDIFNMHMAFWTPTYWQEKNLTS